MRKSTTYARKRAHQSAFDRQRHKDINPVKEAVVRQQIASDVERLRVAANLHAHIGGDAAATLNLAGRLTFIVCHAAGKCGLGQSPEARILAGTANALAEVEADRTALEAQRQTILSGLAAIDRLMPKLSTLDLAEGALLLDGLLNSGDLGTGDVHRALEQQTAKP